MKKYRIKSKFRFTAFLTISMMLIIFIFSNIMGSNKVLGDSMKEYETIRVEDGDTLWSIAAQYTDEDQDIRETVYEICKANDLDSKEIFAGQRILIPLSYR